MDGWMDGWMNEERFRIPSRRVNDGELGKSEKSAHNNISFLSKGKSEKCTQHHLSAQVGVQSAHNNIPSLRVWSRDTEPSPSSNVKLKRTLSTSVIVSFLLWFYSIIL